MAGPFPPLRISPASFHRKELRDVSKVRTPEGGRIATAWSSGTRWTFSVNLVGDEELEALRRHWDEAGGGLDTFLFSCPDQGGEVLVEYDQDELDIERTGPTTHRADIALRSVNG